MLIAKYFSQFSLYVVGNMELLRRRISVVEGRAVYTYGSYEGLVNAIRGTHD